MTQTSFVKPVMVTVLTHLLVAPSHSPRLQVRARHLLCRPTLNVYPFLCTFIRKHVLFYLKGTLQKRHVDVLKAVYRHPMDWLEEVTTRTCFALASSGWQNDLRAHLGKLTCSSPTRSVHASPRRIPITLTPKVVYPGINSDIQHPLTGWPQISSRSFRKTHQTLPSDALRFVKTTTDVDLVGLL
ncbi:hypothetical protein V8E55_011994 [Tylopilus felleus]